MIARIAAGEGSAAEIAESTRHLGDCPACRAALEHEREIQRFIDLVRARVRPAAAESAPQSRDVGLGGRSAAPDRDDDDPRPTELRGYRLLEEISHGGQATVHRAVHEATGRVVAVKVIRSRSTREQARLEREAALVARLRHPGVVTVHDCGRLPDGGLGIVMELVDGVPLDAWSAKVDRESPRAEEANRRRIDAVAKVCDAIDHAHRRGVIHRDLKPANVLVDGADQPRVLDFGVAHAVEPSEHEWTGAAGQHRPSIVSRAITRTGEFAGTLAYAAPEQLGDGDCAADTRSDVYSLGVILFELVCGTMPYPVDGPIERVARSIVHQPPSVPRCDARGVRMDPDLVTIILHALAKDPERRYSSASALGEDLRRLLAGDAIHARRDSALYVLRKTMLKHRVALGVVAGVAVLAVAATVALSLAYRDTRVALALADQESARLADTLRETTLREAIMLAQGDSVARAEELVWREVLAPSSPAAVDAPPGDPEFLAALWALRQLHAHSPCLASAVIGGHARLVGVEGAESAWCIDDSGRLYQIALVDLHVQRSLRSDCASPQEGRTPLVRLDSPRDRICVVRRGSSVVERFDLASGRLVQTLSLPADGPILATAFAPDGTVVVGHSGGVAFARSDDGRFTSVDAPSMTGSCLVTNGTLAAYVTSAGELATVDLRSRAVRSIQPLANASPGTAIGLAMDGDGAVFVAQDDVVRFDSVDGLVRSAQEGRETRTMVEVSPDGSRVASCSVSGLIRVNDTATPAALRVMAGHLHHGRELVGPIAFVADGARLLSGSAGDGSLRLWRCDGSGWISRVEAHVQTVHTLVADGDGGRLLSMGVDGNVVRTEGDRVVSRHGIPAEGAVLFGALSADGRVLVDGENWDDTWFVVRDAETLEPLLPPERCWSRAGPFAFSPDGTLLVAGAGFVRAPLGAGPDRLKLVDPRDGRLRVLEASGVPSGTRAVAVSPDNRRVVWALRDGRILLFDREASELPAPLTTGVAVRSVAFSPDGTRLVSSHENGHLVLWDVATGRKLAEQAVHAHCAMAVAFSPDGTLIASASSGGEVSIVCARRFRRLAMLRDDGEPIFAILFSRDGRRLHLGTGAGSIVTFDLGFHDRAIANNLEFWITMLEREGVEVTNAQPMRAWAEMVGAESQDSRPPGD